MSSSFPISNSKYVKNENISVEAYRTHVNKITPFSKQKYWIQSMIVPGLGQIRNKKYWKLPIIYGGFAGLSYSIIKNTEYYTEMITEYKARTENNTNLIPNPIYDNVPLNQFLNAANYYKRNRTISIILAILLYGLQIVDAYVDQELAKFEISDNLTLNLYSDPNNLVFKYNQNIFNNISYGIRLNF